MSDIVQRLNKDAAGTAELIEHLRLLADNQCREIERLQASLRMTNNQDSWMSRALKLEAALRRIVKIGHGPLPAEAFTEADASEMYDIARDALEGK